jgi:hypothetical protein
MAKKVIFNRNMQLVLFLLILGIGFIVMLIIDNISPRSISTGSPCKNSTGDFCTSVNQCADYCLPVCMQFGYSQYISYEASVGGQGAQYPNAIYCMCNCKK